MTRSKFEQIEMWCEKQSDADAPLSYEAYRYGRYGLQLRCFAPHEYPSTDEGALYFFVEFADAVRDIFNLRETSHGWMTDHVWTVDYDG